MTTVNTALKNAANAHVAAVDARLRAQERAQIGLKFDTELLAELGQAVERQKAAARKLHDVRTTRDEIAALVAAL